MPLTPDAIPTNEQLRESLIDRIYEPHKKLILGGTVAFFLVVLAVLGAREYQRSRLDEMWTRYYDAANQFDAMPGREPDRAAAQRQIDMLSSVAKDYPDDAVTPFAIQRL